MIKCWIAKKIELQVRDLYNAASANQWATRVPYQEIVGYSFRSIARGECHSCGRIRMPDKVKCRIRQLVIVYITSGGPRKSILEGDGIWA